MNNTWILWTALVCLAFILGFFIGAICCADAALAAAKRESEDEGWRD